MLPNTPIVAFTILLLIILTIPPIFERLRLPGLVGLLLGGVVLWPHCLQLLSSDKETMKLLSDIGKIYLMFVIALEIDLEQFAKTRNRSIGFGFLTFLVPVIAGVVVGIILGLGWNASILIGSIIDSVFWSSHCPVAVTRLLADLIDIHKILVPVKNITPQALRTVHFAQLFTDANQASVTLLHVCSSLSSPEQIDGFRSQLSDVFSVDESEMKLKIKVIANDNVAQVIIRIARSFDLIVLRSMRRRTAGGLAVSDVTNEVLKELKCSLVLFGEPHS